MSQGRTTTCRAEPQKTHQDDLLNVLGRAPVEHPRGVVLLHVLVHALNLLVAWDEQRVVSGVGEGGREVWEIVKGFCQKK